MLSLMSNPFIQDRRVFVEKGHNFSQLFSKKKKPLNFQGFFGVKKCDFRAVGDFFRKKCDLFSLRAEGESSEGDRLRIFRILSTSAFRARRYGRGVVPR